ncbi:cytochrome P450 [Streptomyces silvensis]|uniref:Cytochrome n=1 Tax=Streptomyces silvensis TaxID=1765722 RepID=A0A0W7X8X5_9ACTN|nr:cytochrome P450 [Streptomyces silvensis]KUF19358.1 cytochrome [Streptomyces silvensis]
MTIRTDLDLTDAAAFVRHDAHEFWREVRMSRPVYWHDGNPGFWVVARHADVLACYADAASLSSARGTVLDVLLDGGDSAGGKMLAVTDRPRHRELRNLMLRAFSPRVLGAVESGVRARASRLVARVARRGTFDFATEVAEHIPMNTICDLLSIPEADREKLLRWNKLALSSEDAEADPLDSLEARNEIVGYFMDLARQRRRDPGDDVVSMIATARVGEGPLTLEEVALNCYSLVLGGDESSRVSAICAVKTLAEHPEQWRALRAGSAGIDGAVEEVLRWATPARHFARTATRDLEIGGRHVRAGDIVTLWNTSANNDEEVFDRPRRFDLTRSPNKHLSFGHGPHFCVGAFLGRAELRALLAALVETVDEIEVCGPPTPIYSNFLNGYSSLPVAFR